MGRRGRPAPPDRFDDDRAALIAVSAGVRRYQEWTLPDECRTSGTAPRCGEGGRGFGLWIRQGGRRRRQRRSDVAVGLSGAQGHHDDHVLRRVITGQRHGRIFTESAPDPLSLSLVNHRRGHPTSTRSGLLAPRFEPCERGRSRFTFVLRRPIRSHGRSTVALPTPGSRATCRRGRSPDQCPILH